MANKMRPIDGVASVAGSESELSRYLTQLEQHFDVVDALAFWMLYTAILAPLAEYFVSAPASQACVARSSSVTGLFSSGRRNRIHAFLEIRDLLKLHGRFLEFWTKFKGNTSRPSKLLPKIGLRNCN